MVDTAMVAMVAMVGAHTVEAMAHMEAAMVEQAMVERVESVGTGLADRLIHSATPLILRIIIIAMTMTSSLFEIDISAMDWKEMEGGQFLRSAHIGLIGMFGRLLHLSIAVIFWRFFAVGHYSHPWTHDPFGNTQIKEICISSVKVINKICGAV